MNRIGPTMDKLLINEQEGFRPNRSFSWQAFDLTQFIDGMGDMDMWRFSDLCYSAEGFILNFKARKASGGNNNMAYLRELCLSLCFLTFIEMTNSSALNLELFYMPMTKQ